MRDSILILHWQTREECLNGCLGIASLTGEGEQVKNPRFSLLPYDRSMYLMRDEAGSPERGTRKRDLSMQHPSIPPPETA